MSAANKNSIENIYDDLQGHLMTSGRIKSMSQEFAALRTDIERVDFAHNLLDVYDLFPALVDGGKNNEMSGKMRQQGNEMFKIRKGEEALEFYTKSIAMAENTSENLALAFANRSAVLFEKGFYEECLAIIERTGRLFNVICLHASKDLGLSYSSIQGTLAKHKMHAFSILKGQAFRAGDEIRAAFCERILLKMQEDPNFLKNIWTDESKFCTEGIINRRNWHFGQNKIHELCTKDIERALDYNYPVNLKPKLMIRKEKATVLKSMQSHQHYYEPIPKISEGKRNCSIQCASDSVAIEYSDILGRHIVATRDIEIGEIIAIERPFCQVLIDQYYNHCHECLQLCYNLIPCNKCVMTLYCSEKCRDSAIYCHRYSCKILPILEFDKLEIISMKIALSVKDEYKTIKNYKNDVQNSEYRSDRYKEIHNLVGNTELRSVSDLFRRSTTAAIIFQLIKKYTQFFETLEEEDIFKEILLLHLQTGPCNFHEISEMSEEDNFYISREIGAGAYSFLSMFNHSCSPNAVRHCYGSTIVVRTIESIKAGDQCFDNYGYHYAVTPKEERRSQLKKQYFFYCNCKVCANHWPLYQNVFANTSALVDDEDLYRLERGDVETAKKVSREIPSKMRQIEKFQPNQNFAALQEVLKQCFAIFGNMSRPL